MRKVVPVVFLMLVSCTAVYGQSVDRKSVYDSIYNDITVISKDLEIRALDTSQSKYASAVARLEMETARAKDLLRAKAVAEGTDLLTYESWIRAADAAHDAKLLDLGNEKRIYLERWSQRYFTLQQDAAAIKALKDNEKARYDRCMRSGVSGFVRTLLGRNDTETSRLDVGAVGNLGTLTNIMLP